MKRDERIKGSILLIVLLMVGVIAIISAEILLRGRSEIRQAMGASVYDRAYLDVQGYQYWAIQTLKAYKEKEAALPTVFKNESFEWGAHIVGEWQDQQALFNLNALRGDEAIRKNFINFLVQVGKVEAGEALLIAREIEKYLNVVGMMVSGSELRTVKRVSQNLFLKIQKYLTALPNREHKININGVNREDPAVLLTVADKMTLEQAKALIFCRSDFVREADSSEFMNCIKQKNIPFNPEYIIYSSRYFLAIAYIKIESQVHTLYTLLEKVLANNNQPPFVRLLWQSLDAK